MNDLRLDDDEESDTDTLSPRSHLRRRPSATSTATTPSIVPSFSTNFTHSTTDRDDAASSLAPFLDTDNNDNNYPRNNDISNHDPTRRRRSSLLRNALGAFRRPSSSSSTSALFTAALTGDLPMLTSYHAAGGRIDLLTHDNLTALHLAASADRANIVEFLLVNTASISPPPPPAPPSENRASNIAPRPTAHCRHPLTDARSKREDRTPLYLAASASSLSSARMLLYTGHADATSKSKNDGATALHAAARSGNLPMLELLLDAPGADINMPDIEGLRPLNWAMQGVGKDKEAKVDAVRLLLKRGAAVNLRTNKGFTSLQGAVQTGDVGVVRALLEHHLAPGNRNGFDVEEGRNGHNRSQNNNDENSDDEEGNTTTTTTTTRPHPCTCINADSPYSMRAIHSAVFSNRPDLISLLIGAGADVEARTHKGWTPLHVAARFGYQGCRRVLVEQGGADERAKTRKGSTPRDVARKWGMQWDK